MLRNFRNSQERSQDHVNENNKKKKRWPETKFQKRKELGFRWK